MRRVRCGLMVALALGAVAPRSFGQGAFIVPDQPLGGVGNNGTELLIDTDGDAVLETYPIPPELDNAQSQFFLTPSRQLLYAFEALSVPPPISSPCTIAHSVRAFLFRIVRDSDPANDFGTLEVVHDGVCLGEIARVGFFDPIDGAQRIAFIRQLSGVDPQTQEVLWINLNGVNQSIFKTYTSDIGAIHFAPTGMVGFVQRDLTSGLADGDYTFVCLHPAALGDQLAVFDVLAGPAALATLELDQNGDEVARIRHNEIPIPQSFVSLQGCGPPVPETGPCCVQPSGCQVDLTAFQCTTWWNGNWLGTNNTCSDCPPPPPEGACCLIEGFCIDRVSSTNCASRSDAIWLGVGSDCTDCPQIDLTVSKTATDEVDVGDPIVYTVRYENIGTEVANNTVLADFFYFPDAIPSDGGVFDESLGFGTIRWDIGTLLPGESGEVTVTVPTVCSTSSPVTNGSAWISADYVGNVFSQEIIETIVHPLPTIPLQASLSSAPSNRFPLISGDIITHTISLTNTISEPRPAVHFSIRLRNSVERFVQTLDDGGGTATLNQVFPGRVTSLRTRRSRSSSRFKSAIASKSIVPTQASIVASRLTFWTFANPQSVRSSRKHRCPFNPLCQPR